MECCSGSAFLGETAEGAKSAEKTCHRYAVSRPKTDPTWSLTMSNHIAPRPQTPLQTVLDQKK